jgi:nitrile hydratase subunit beta
MTDHDHDHHHHDHSELSETELRVRALETILTEKGYVEPTALDAIIQAYETKIGPHNGAQVVAKAWTDPAFKRALLDDATRAVSTLGHVSRVGDHLVAVENTPARHNMVVCTLCSCYPWEMLGLPPVWYKAAPYRSRAVKDPRGVLADFGVSLPKETEIRVWDSTAETRFLVLERAAARRARDARFHDRHWTPENAGRPIMNGVHDMGGMDGFGKVEPEPNEPMFHAEWEARVLAMVRAMGAAGAFNIDTSRFYRETLPPHVYLASSYYKKWLLGLEDLLIDKGFIAAEDVAAGHAVKPPKPLKRGKFGLDDVERVMVRGKFARPAPAPAKFKAGDRVRAKNIHPATHTRLPRYVRGHVGVVERDHGCHVFPDSAAMEAGENPQWLYTVVFDGAELWGPDADPTVKISIDAFEPYLEAA